MKKPALVILRNFGLTLLLSITFPEAVLAATTTLTFDEFSDGTTLTTQYQGLGVTASGVTVYNAVSSPWPAISGPNIAAALTGLMTFTLDSSITGNITTVSAYVSGDTGTGIFAYDSSGFLVGQSLLAANSTNALLSVTTSGNPITSVAIHDGGASFGVDNFSFTQAVAAPNCPQLAQKLYDGIVALPNADFKSGSISAKRAKLKSEVADLQNLLSVNSSPSQQLYQLNKIKYDINDWIKPGTNRTNLLNLIDQLIAKVNAGQC